MRIRVVYKTRASLLEDIELQIHGLASTGDEHLKNLRMKEIIEDAYRANLIDWLIALEYDTLPKEWKTMITHDEWRHLPALSASRVMTNANSNKHLWPRSSERK